MEYNKAEKYSGSGIELIEENIDVVRTRVVEGTKMSINRHKVLHGVFESGG